MKVKPNKAPKPPKNKVLHVPKPKAAHSDYWLDTSIEEMDISKLASVQRAVVNFTRILAKKAIPTTYSTGQQSYTDGQTVVLSAPKSLKDIDSTVGLALHEASHIVYTDFTSHDYIKECIDHYQLNDAERILNTFPEKPWVRQFFTPANLKNLVNILEDRRIDQLVCNSAPGYQGYYQALYDRYFNAKVINEALKTGQCVEPTYANYEFQLTNCTNPYFDASCMPGLEAIMNVIDLPNITRFTNTREVVDIAMQVLIMICNNINAPEASSPPQQSQANGTSAEQDQDENNMDQPNPSQSGPGGDRDSGEDEAGDDESDEGEAGDDEANGDADGDGDGDGGEAPGAGNDESSQESDTDSGTADAQSAATPSDSDRKNLDRLNKAIQQQREFLEGNIRKNRVSKDTARVLDNISKGILEEVELEYKDAYNAPRKVTCAIVKGIAGAQQLPGMHNHLRDTKWHKDHVRAWVLQGMQIGQQLGNRLKTRTEIHSLTTTRQANGRIDKRLLAELGFNNDHVFTQTKFESVRPAHIHVSIDASGSMDGTKFNSALKTAVAVAKAATMIDEVTCMITLRGSYIPSARKNRYADAQPCMFIVYDSTIDRLNAAFVEKLCLLDPGGSTPEALCYDAAANIIEKHSQNRDSFLINLSDGAPCWDNYDHNTAVKHCKQTMTKFRNSGIQVLSYFVYSSDYELQSIRPTFTDMYGSSACFIDISSLSQLSSSINRLLEYKQK